MDDEEAKMTLLKGTSRIVRFYPSPNISQRLKHHLDVYVFLPRWILTQLSVQLSNVVVAVTKDASAPAQIGKHGRPKFSRS